MELLPAFALFLAFLLDGIIRWRPHLRRVLPAAAAVLILLNTVLLLRAQPLVYGEAVANSRERIQFEQALARALAGLPPNARILMYTSSHVGAIQQAGIPLRHIVNEGDYDRWQSALKAPAAATDIVVAIDEDVVARAVAAHPGGLELLEVICGKGQGCARIYHSQLSGGSSQPHNEGGGPETRSPQSTTEEPEERGKR
jgi:hypothetical protein